MGEAIVDFSDFLWGTPLLVLLMGGGLFFLFYMRFAPYRYFGHALGILSGKYDQQHEAGDLNHLQALSTAIAGTVGMGNISGVAIAIVTGGPGAIFWMWVSALIGVSTKFFTNTLAVMYRGKDDRGEVQGGPMYVIREGLGRRWNWMAYAFSLFAMVGVLPVFQANQLTQIVHDVLLVPAGAAAGMYSKLVVGGVILAIVLVVVVGGVKRIGKVASYLVPFMVGLYLLMVLWVMVVYAERIVPSIVLIFTDAFRADSVLGGALGSLIILGVRRAAFSNEAGIGTAPMAHGAAKTNEPVREGLVAMLGPVIDTVVVCSLTAIAIVVTGVWDGTSNNGVTVTVAAFEAAMPGWGAYLLLLAVSVFSFTTLFAYPYYGKKSISFLLGTRFEKHYLALYLLSIPIAAVVKMTVVVSLIDAAFALMALPNMLAALLLAPKVKAAANDYFARYEAQKRAAKATPRG